LGDGLPSSSSSSSRESSEGGGTLGRSHVLDVPNIAPEAPPIPRKRPVILRPARVGNNDDYVIFIECDTEYVMVYPSRRRVPLEALNHSPLHNPLYKAVEEMLKRRLSTLRPGEQPPHVQIRFLVHRDADRTMHLAYPALETLPVEKVRYNLQPEDDVARIIRSY
jgi:hypothetical protein